jgi:hypothetical protein
VKKSLILHEGFCVPNHSLANRCCCTGPHKATGYKQEEQDENNQKHDCPSGKTTKYSAIVHAGQLLSTGWILIRLRVFSKHRLHIRL